MNAGDSGDLLILKQLGADHLDLPFWAGTRREELLLHRCGLCGRHYWPASRCVTHGAANMAWTPSSGRGTVHTYTILHHAYTAEMATQVPYCVAVVELEEGPFFHSNIVGCPVDQIHVGLPVQVRFVVQKAGRLTLPVFTPVSGHDDDRRAGA